MIAQQSRPTRPPHPLMHTPGLPTILIGLLALLILVSAWASGFVTNVLFAAYLLFVAVTIRAIRSVPVEPGVWLGRRVIRRSLVLLIVAICLDFTLAPGPLSGATFLLFLLLVVGDVALRRATSRIASAKEEAVDERQEALRNRAFRIAYGIFALAVGGTIFVTYAFSAASRAWLAGAPQGGPVIAFLELLFFLPAMVVAWLQPDRLADEDAGARPYGAAERRAILMIAVAILVPIILSLTIVVAPVRTSATVRLEPVAPGAHCDYVHAVKEVGIAYGASLPIAAVVCWDGLRATEQWGLNASDCGLVFSAMAVVETTRCTRVTDPDGTLRFVYGTRVRSALLPFVSRDVTLALVLTRDGRMVQFP